MPNLTSFAKKHSCVHYLKQGNSKYICGQRQRSYLSEVPTSISQGGVMSTFSVKSRLNSCYSRYHLYNI